MLYFKINELLLFAGIRSPHRFLMRTFGFRNSKAYSLIKNKTRTISLDDLSEICHLMNCTPNDLLYWDNSKKVKLADNHPITQALTPPPKNVDWKNVHNNLTLEQNMKLREYAQKIIEENKK